MRALITQIAATCTSKKVKIDEGILAILDEQLQQGGSQRCFEGKE
jgi:hypothetical protein